MRTHEALIPCPKGTEGLKVWLNMGGDAPCVCGMRLKMHIDVCERLS